MSRVLLAWELGGGYAHVARQRQLAESLKGAGHACAFAVRNLLAAEAYNLNSLGPVHQAPVRLGEARNPVRTQVSYASLLHNVGFDHPTELAARIGAWRNLMRLLRSEYLVTDHSPIALIAARSLRIPTVALGTGFTLPPPCTPYPSFRPRMRITDDVLRDNEAAVLQELNAAMAALKLEPLETLQAIHADAHRVVETYEELDPYAEHRDEPYVGAPRLSRGDAPRWPDGTGPKIFVHLRPARTNQPLLLTLCKTGCRVLIRSDGVRPDTIQPFLRPGMIATDQALNFELVARDADAVISAGSHGLICEHLLAGKPGLVIPDIHERTLTARRTDALGATLSNVDRPSLNLEAAVSQLIEDDDLREAAQGFATRYAKTDRNGPQQQVARAIGPA